MKKQAILSLAIVGFLGGSTLTHAQFAVHDPAQTAATVAEFAKQLEEWSEQHQAMSTLNDLNEKIRGYQEELNGLIGKPEEAVKALVDAQQLIDRLNKFDQIEDILDFEAEIGRLENLTDAITNKVEVFGDLAFEVGDQEIVREEAAYRRHVLTNKRVDAYQTERNVTATELAGVSQQLLTAQEKAAQATTESEQLAALIELQGINAQLRMMSLRMEIRSNDVMAHDVALRDREMLEKRNTEDAFEAVLAESYETQIRESRARRLATINSRRRSFGKAPLTQLPGTESDEE